MLEASAPEWRRLMRGMHIPRLPCEYAVSRGESRRPDAQRVFCSQRIRRGEIQYLCVSLSAASKWRWHVPTAKHWGLNAREQRVVLTAAFMSLSDLLIIDSRRSTNYNLPSDVLPWRMSFGNIYIPSSVLVARFKMVVFRDNKKRGRCRRLLPPHQSAAKDDL